LAEALDAILPSRLDELARRVLSEARMRRLRLATAESCTGGLLASLLTDLPGCSHVFERGFVVYSEDAKVELLGISRALLEGPGAVSEPCALAMAEGALAHSRADLAVSITGWTDAGSAPGQEAGLVYFGCARRNRPTVCREVRMGDIGRARIRIGCLGVGLSMMLDRMGG
jgi:nicotinamide-nucleotide amidase